MRTRGTINPLGGPGVVLHFADEEGFGGALEKEPAFSVSQEAPYLCNKVLMGPFGSEG